MKKFVWVVMIVFFSVSFALNTSAAKPFKIAAIFQTAIEEPWDGVIHQACLKAKKEMGNIEYEFTEKIAAADFEKVLREYAERGFDLIVGDAFLAGEEPARRVAKDYPEMATAAVFEMNRQVGVHQVDRRGVARRGVMIRHLVMPNRVAGTKNFVKWVAENLPKLTYVNVMPQYHVDYKAYDYPEIARGITVQKFLEAMDWAEKYGLTGLDPRSVRVREFYTKSG